MNVTWSAPEFARIARLVHDHAGLRLPAHRRDEVETVIRRVAADRGRALDDFAGQLERDALLLGDLVSELTIGETYFLRDLPHLELVRDLLVPEVQRLRGRDHVFRAWSAGCSTGEEAWSLAILLDQAGVGRRSSILATDISRPALARARRAEYREWSLRGAGRATAEPYLRQVGDGWVVGPRLRDRVRFEYLNLAEEGYPSFPSGVWGMDLILCRNVFIYFERELVEAVAGRLHAALAEGGWLLTAATDPSLRHLGLFEVEQTPAGTIYRRPVGLARSTAASAAPRRRAVAPTPLPSLAPPEPTPAPQGQAAPEPQGALADAVAEAYARGDYHAVADRGEALLHDPVTACLLVRSLANLGQAEEAETHAAAAVGAHPLASELHLLRVLLQMELGRWDEALDAARRVLYLDRGLIVAHLALGAIQRRRGRTEEAVLAYRNARKLALALPPEVPVRLADGQVAGRLAEMAEAQLSLLGAAPNGRS